MWVKHCAQFYLVCVCVHVIIVAKILLESFMLAKVLNFFFLIIHVPCLHSEIKNKEF